MNNKSAIIITSLTGMLILAALIGFIVWMKNKNKANQTDVYLASLNAINTPFDFGTNIYDVMASGNRNDSVAAANNGGGSGSLLGL